MLWRFIFRNWTPTQKRLINIIILLNRHQLLIVVALHTSRVTFCFIVCFLSLAIVCCKKAIIKISFNFVEICCTVMCVRKHLLTHMRAPHLPLLCGPLKYMKLWWQSRWSYDRTLLLALSIYSPNTLPQNGLKEGVMFRYMFTELHFLFSVALSNDDLLKVSNHVLSSFNFFSICLLLFLFS